MKKNKKRRGRPAVEGAKQRLNVRVSATRKARYEKAAKAAGLKLSAWIKLTLDRASR